MSRGTHDMGKTRVSYDKLEIVSSAWPGWLWKRLPIKELRRLGHLFDIKPICKNPYYRSRIILVCVPSNCRALEFLMEHEPSLLGYAVTVAEIAADIPAQSDRQAVANHLASIGLVSKRRNVRGDVIVVFDENPQVPQGIIDGPTLYYEHARSSVAFKSYCRYDKAPEGKFTAQPVTRWEWTLKGTAAIKRHLGGNQLADLLNADLHAFVARNIKHVCVDYVAVGSLIQPKGDVTKTARIAVRPDKNKRRSGFLADPDFWAQQRAYRFLRSEFYRATEGCTNCTDDIPCRKHEVEEIVWQQSPVKIRSVLTRPERRKRGRPRKELTRKRRPITAYQIKRCFPDV